VTRIRGETVSGPIRTLFGVGAVAGLTDGQLLQRFADGGGEAAELAFAALVERHGPTVLRVCGWVLSDPQDVHDAFQATFLVLVRRAGSIRRRDSVASWLYGVALRVASGARSATVRRRVHERRAAELRSGGAIASTAQDRDLREAVHEEIGHLPDPYRAPLLLCDLEGLTHEEAARRLGWPVGTVKSRQARGRERLRGRLIRRGLAPAGAGACGGIFAARSAQAAVPAALVHEVVGSAMRVASARGAAGVVSAPVAALVEGGLEAMLMAKLKVGAAILLVAGVLGGGGAILAQQASGRPRSSRATRGPEGSARRAAPARAESGKPYLVEPPDLLAINFRLGNRQTTSEYLVRPDGTISLGSSDEIPVANLTTREIKEKILLHYRERYDDGELGLVKQDPKTGRLISIPPAESDRLDVSVSAFNSKVYYVEGEVRSPGRLVITGSETVLDAMNYAGGPTPSALLSGISLSRVGPAGTRNAAQVLPVDYEAIRRGDPTTNYALMPGDRLVVPRDPEKSGRDRAETPAAGGDDLRALERRLESTERKLDQLIEALKMQGVIKGDLPPRE
jgi:polysaccharide biosynthesis/export protein